jgi:hypothetical protein
MLTHQQTRCHYAQEHSMIFRNYGVADSVTSSLEHYISVKNLGSVYFLSGAQLRAEGGTR